MVSENTDSIRLEFSAIVVSILYRVLILAEIGLRLLIILTYRHESSERGIPQWVVGVKQGNGSRRNANSWHCAWHEITYIMIIYMITYIAN